MATTPSRRRRARTRGSWPAARSTLARRTVPGRPRVREERRQEQGPAGASAAQPAQRRKASPRASRFMPGESHRQGTGNRGNVSPLSGRSWGWGPSAPHSLLRAAAALRRACRRRRRSRAPCRCRTGAGRRSRRRRGRSRCPAAAQVGHARAGVGCRTGSACRRRRRSGRRGAGAALDDVAAAVAGGAAVEVLLGAGLGTQSAVGDAAQAGDAAAAAGLRAPCRCRTGVTPPQPSPAGPQVRAGKAGARERRAGAAVGLPHWPGTPPPPQVCRGRARVADRRGAAAAVGRLPAGGHGEVGARQRSAGAAVRRPRTRCRRRSRRRGRWRR